MSCEAVEGSFVALLDGEIGGEERRAVELHVGTCPSCARELEQLGATLRLVTRQLASAGAARSAGSFDELWTRIEATERPLRVIAGGAAARPARRHRAVWAGAGGLALAASLAALVLGLQGGESVPMGALPSPPAAAQRATGDAPVKAAPRAASRVAAKAPVKEGTQVAKRAPADEHPAEQVAEVANEIDPPRELLERPELFINYPVVRKLDELQHLESVLADPGDEGGAG